MLESLALERSAWNRTYSSGQARNQGGEAP